MIHFNDTEFDDLADYINGIIVDHDTIVYGFACEYIGWQLMPPRVLNLCPKDDGDGKTLQGGYYTSRTFTIRGKVQADDAATLVTRLAALNTLFDVSQKKPLDIEYLDPVVDEVVVPRVFQAIPWNFKPISAAYGDTVADFEITFKTDSPLADGELEGDTLISNPDDFTWPPA